MDRRIDAINITMLPEWEEKIDEELAKIAEHHPGAIHHFRATLFGTKHHRHGLFEIHVVASVPGDTIVVKEKGERVRPMIVAAFDFLDRELAEYDRRRQNLVKTHEERPMGTISEVFPAEGYGFIRTAEGDEVYFHKNAVKTGSISEMKAGDKVAFGVEQGEKGPQATWVRPT